MRGWWHGFLGNWHFWAITVLFGVGVLLQYPQQFHLTDASSVFSFVGLTRHAFERILLLIPICYAAVVFGWRGGLISLVVAASIMIPRVFLLSQYPADALVETVGIIIFGLVGNLWLQRYRQEKYRRQQALTNLESSYHQLQDRTLIIEQHEQQLSVLNHIAGIISRSLELEQILDLSVESVVEQLGMDGAWIYLLNTEESVLVLSAHRGNSEGPPTIKPGFGFSGQVIKTGKPAYIDNPPTEQEQTKLKNLQIGSVLVVPIRSRGQLSGTLGISSGSHRPFKQYEIDLALAIGDQIGMAIDNARLFKQQQEIAWALIKSEQQYRELFENAHDAIWVHDLDGNMVTSNAATEAMTGYTHDELLTMNVRSLLGKESLVMAGKIRSSLLSMENIEQPYEQQLLRRDGTEAYLKLTTNLLSHNGKPSGFLHIARDVTLEKQMQDKLAFAYDNLSESHRRLKESQEQLVQAEKLSSLGQLAASIAHEVNNPLSGILVYTQLLIRKLKEESLNKETSLDYLSKMERELVRSTKLIRNLLDFARQSPPTFREVNINEVVTRSFELTAHSAEMQQVRVYKELQSSLPKVTADFDQLQQVCTNLILNAIQAMPGGGRLILRTSFENNQLKIEIRDTGHGISPENIPHLFTPFFTTKREIKGVGLGLAVAYGIVQRHKGNIEVQSQEGKGATFTVYLPPVLISTSAIS